MILLKFTKYEEIDEKKLMEVYFESNMENTEYFCPGEKDKEKALAFVEKGFLNFLKTEFFSLNKSTYWVLADENKYISALRTNEIRNNIYYLEALETNPGERNKGFGKNLLFEVIEQLKKEGSFKLCSCVNKNNSASIKLHKKCGFEIVSDIGINYIYDESDSREYSLEYKYEK